jgi:putative Holliday junction resolvase
MTREDHAHFLSQLPQDARLAGVDWGSKTIGVATGTLSLRIATPLRTLARSKFQADVKALKSLCDDYDVAGLVIGLPLHLDGGEGRRVQSVKDLMAELYKVWPIPFTYQDERHSTIAMHQFLIEEVDLSRQRRADVIDKMAAQVILQRFFDDLPD